ncbi:MAG: hypothetical protein AAGK78_05845 [Planctomycetota bacterium]
MTRLLEILLGTGPDFLDQGGQYELTFHPSWPFAELIGHGTWNLLLLAAAVALVVWVYRREGKSRKWRIALAAGRLGLLALLITLLNRPALTLTQARVDPSVLAVLADDSLSMRVRDIQRESEEPISRASALRQLLDAESAALAEEHQLRLFTFTATARPVETLPGEPTGTDTKVTAAVADALRQLRGQNLAGVLLLTDGKDAPAVASAAAVARSPRRACRCSRFLSAGQASRPTSKCNPSSHRRRPSRATWSTSTRSSAPPASKRRPTFAWK